MTKEEAQIGLKNLTEEIDKLKAEREKYFKEHMHLFAEFQIGEAVVNIYNGQEYVVSGHYKYGEKYDSWSVSCYFTRDNVTDNSSCYSGFHPYIRIEDYRNRTKEYVWKLESLARWARF